MRHQVLVDSRDRDYEKYASAGRYRVRLPRSYTNVVAARVLSVEVPMSFHAFQAAHNNTTVRIVVDGESHDVTVRDGNYTPTTLAAELHDALEQAFNHAFTVSIDARTNRLVVACANFQVAVDTTAVAADDARTDWGLAYYLGFPAGVVTAGTPLVGPGPVNASPVTYVLLDIDELGVVDEGGLYGSAVGKGFLCKLPVQGAAAFAYASRDVERAGEAVAARSLVPRLENLTVAWRTHDGRAIDFRGMEHSMLLEIVTRDRTPPHAALPNAAVPEPEPEPEKTEPVGVPTPESAPAPPPSSGPPRLALAAGGVVLAGAAAWWLWPRTP